MRAPVSVLVSALAGFVANLLVFVGSLWLFVGNLESRWHTGHFSASPAGFPLTGFALALSLFGTATAIGLYGIRRWARRIAVQLFPIFSASLFMAILMALSLTRNDVSGGALLTVGQGLDLAILMYLLIPLLAVSFWWLLLLNRRRVRELHKANEFRP